MELPQVGQQCEEPTCKQLDFLPYRCKCNKIFCADHYLIHTETCPIIREHYKEANLNAKSTLWKCSHPDCKETSLIPLICSKCHQHYCVVHRHVTECHKEDSSIKEAAIAKMKAPIEEFNAAKAKVDKQLDINIQAATKNKKKNEMAVKLQLMRIKNKATGPNGIPTTDRVYFNIIKPDKYKNESQAVFVSKNWSLGRAIDAIASECKITNNNNMNHAEKLRFSMSDDKLQDLSAVITNLLHDNTLIDGQNLTLEYVPP